MGVLLCLASGPIQGSGVDQEPLEAGAPTPMYPLRPLTDMSSAPTMCQELGPCQGAWVQVSGSFHARPTLSGRRGFSWRRVRWV